MSIQEIQPLLNVIGCLKAQKQLILKSTCDKILYWNKVIKISKNLWMRISNSHVRKLNLQVTTAKKLCETKHIDLQSTSIIYNW